MRPFALLTTLFLLQQAPAAEPLRVAVYADGGAMEPYITKATDAATSAGMVVTRVLAVDLVAGALDAQDVVVFPGGTGNGQARSLGEGGSARVRDFARAGGGVIGICAGGYLLAEGYNEGTRRVQLIRARLWDLDNWARGSGTVTIQNPSDSGASPIAIHFENAPVFEPTTGLDDLAPYVSLARFASDVAGEPEGRESIAGKDAIIAGPYGEGRVVLFGPHPELTPGLEWMLPAALRWAAGVGDATPSWESVFAAAQPPIVRR